MASNLAINCAVGAIAAAMAVVAGVRTSSLCSDTSVMVVPVRTRGSSEDIELIVQLDGARSVLRVVSSCECLAITRAPQTPILLDGGVPLVISISIDWDRVGEAVRPGLVIETDIGDSFVGVARR